MNILTRWFWRIGYKKRMKNPEYRKEIQNLFNKKWGSPNLKIPHKESQND